ncbi:hypothetical protein Tco_0440040 [Tanacetum coccineum]
MIFRYLKGQPKLGLWYPKDSPFDLVAYTDSDYAGASLDTKSTIGGFQFFGCRLISWKCKKQTVVANSITKADYVAASSCCSQLMLLGINLLLLLKVNAARHKLTTAVKIAFLDKHAKSEGFEQIVDFLNASSIRYALTVNPTIYTSCIQQFWATVKVKNVNREVQLQALVDGKKIIITEATIRRDLQLEDAEGSLNDKILVSKSDSSSRCARCGTPVDGPSCRGCAFLRKKFDEDLLAYCVENGIFKDFQNTSESSDDNTNVVNALREPCVVNQDPGEKSSQEPPQIVPIIVVMMRTSNEQQLVDRKIKEITNDLGIRRFRGEEIDEEYEEIVRLQFICLKQIFMYGKRNSKKG